MSARNCWEIIACGREPGGSREHELGPCPAATETRLHGINHGHNAGRACWVIEGTLDGGCKRGTFIEKMPECARCTFYRQVVDEEGIKLASTPEMLALLREARPRDDDGEASDAVATAPAA